MGLLDRLLHTNAAEIAMKQDEPSTALVPATSVDIPDTSWPSDIDFTGWVNGMYCREYAVRTVVDFITRNIASLPLKVYRKTDGDPQEVRDGALAQLMRRPSHLPGMSRYRFVSSLMNDMLMEDKWLCVLGVHNDRWMLRRIPADAYSLTGNAFGEITDVTITGTDGNPGLRYRLPDPRIILDVGYVSGLRFGDPVTNVLRPLLNEARAMAKYRQSVAANGGQFPAYVYRPKEMSPWPQDDYDAFVQYMRNYTHGGGQEGGMPTLYDGMEIRTVENLFKPVDMDDLKAREEINISVALAFQISPENIGFRTGTNSNISAYKEKLWNIELLPYVIAFEDALNNSLPEAVGEPDCYIRANLDSKLRGTLIEQYQALSTATGRAFMTTNEGRRILDLDRVEGGDELVTPLNVTQGGQPSPQDGGRTQNAQTGDSQNGKSADDIFQEFRYRYQYDAAFRAQWDAMSKGGEP